MDIISYAKACKAGGGGDKYQEKLVSGQNIKTVNGQDILGAGNLAVTTYQPFNTNWTTDSTIDAFCASVDADASAVEGMAYLGELTCSDLPFVGNADTVVEIMSGSGTSGKAIHVTITSGDIAPHRWDYTYWSNGQKTSGWVAAAQVEANPTMAGDEGALSGIEINGTKYMVGGGHLYNHHIYLRLWDGINSQLSLEIFLDLITTDAFVYDTEAKLATALQSIHGNNYISVPGSYCAMITRYIGGADREVYLPGAVLFRGANGHMSISANGYYIINDTKTHILLQYIQNIDSDIITQLL